VSIKNQIINVVFVFGSGFSSLTFVFAPKISYVLNVLDSFVIKQSCYVLNGYLKSPEHIKIDLKLLKMAFY
jgi:hypothetical protein